MTDLKPVLIDIVSDIVCPWCYIGKSRLDRALAIAQDVPVQVRYHPYFLEPRLPKEGISREEFVVMQSGCRTSSTTRSSRLDLDFDTLANYTPPMQQIEMDNARQPKNLEGSFTPRGDALVRYEAAMGKCPPL